MWHKKKILLRIVVLGMPLFAFAFLFLLQHGLGGGQGEQCVQDESVFLVK